MKKQIVIITVLMILMLSGCAKQDNYGLSTKTPEEITVWHYYNGAQAIAFENMVVEFNTSVGLEKGISVNSESKSSINELADAILAATNKKAGAEPMPNIFQSYLDTAVEIDNASMLADLNQYITEEEKAQYIDGYVEEGYFGKEGEWKLFPIAKSTEVLVLNKTDWDKFQAETGVQESELLTWEGLCKVAEQYYEYSDGKSFFGRDAFANYMIVGSKQLGKELFLVENGDATLQFDKEIMRKLWDNFYVPYIKGYYNHLGRYRTDDIKIGRIIAFVGSTSGMLYFPEEVTIEDEAPYAIERMILPLPNFEGTKPYAVQQGASMAVTKSTPKAEYASAVFLKWITQEDRNIEFASQSGYLPVKKAANNVEKVVELVDEEADIVSVGIQQAKEYEMFTSKGFSGGADARNLLENSMKDLAVANRQSVVENIIAGKDEQEAVNEYLQDEYFEQWFLEMQKQLEDICK